MSDDNKWSQPDSPPPPLFTGKREKDLVKQVNDEVIERVIGQTVLYYPISTENSNFHPVYGECVKKNFLNPFLDKEFLSLTLIAFSILQIG